MKFDAYIPCERLRPYIKQFVVSENDAAAAYKVFPSTGMVIGFQYRGQLATEHGQLASAGITGMSDSYKVFRNSAHTGTVLIYFTETGFTHFAAHPAHTLFGLSLSLDHIFDRHAVQEVEEKLAEAGTDRLRIKVTEQFLLSRLKDIATDKLVMQAVQLIYQSNGNIRIKEISERLFISQSPLEMRFRKVVGATPKKFASIVRFNAVLKDLNHAKTLTEICYAHQFFDQAHFIKDFRQFTGDTPENFKRFL
ncbi:helix-turn-helix domain-containing protein [Chitinophaga sedimenti]|uniref:helix-turn-helix domain-containing protein n=1 Tax=Chitinophaga sedimenti TaxID=2033606 RepID=UPI002005302F|nr:helix-turn-helix domain-containing protein [Chitinophaga sedimenti]MCK7555926.1 helix-turn-helix domain-containing protein [Chitinophaga sedimenti]